MGRSNSSSSNSNNNSLISSGESGLVSSSSTYLPNFPSSQHHHHAHHYAAGGAQNHHHHHHHPQLYQLPPSPPIHPQQYINMGHLAAQAQQFYEVTNNNSSCGGGSGGGGGSTPPISTNNNNNNLTPPSRVYSPHGSNSSNSGSSSALSYVSSGSVGGGGGGIGGSNGTLTIMEAINGGGVTVGGGGANVKCEYEDFPHEPDGGPVKIATWKDHVAVFSMDQVGVMCDVLLQEGDMVRLVDLLATVGKDFIGRSEKILRAQAHVAFHAAEEDPRKFPQVYKILETNSFSPQYHAGLQKLWFSAHYREAEITRGRPLGAVDKYRIRRKFQLPRTIWDGEETVYCFKERSRNALRQSFALEKYPNLEEKKKLSKETGLSMTQVGNWFKNKRQREKEKMQGKPGAKRPSKSPYSTPAALAAAMTPDLLGMMLNPAAVNQSHLHHHHHHPSAGHHHPHHHQSHIAPLSPEDLENAIRKARYEEARLKNYIDENMYSQQTQAAQPLSPSNLQTYLHHHHHHNNGPTNNNNVSPRSSSSSQQHQMVLPGKSDITVGIVGSPGTNSAAHHHQESSPRSNCQGSGAGGVGLTITTIPSPNNSASPQNDHSGGGNIDASPQQQQQQQQSSGDLYGGGGGVSRPRSTSSNPSPSVGRCGADLVPFLHPSAAHHHHHHHHPHHQHNPYNHHHHSGYDTGVPSLIHPGATAALSHA